MSSEIPHTDDVPSPNSRSEIVFVYDAVDANPNGNPLSASNRPRIDPQTEQCIVTDVRLKRYLRDQLDTDGHGVYIRSVKDEEGMQADRETLLEERLSNLTLDEVDDDDLKDAVYGALLDNSVDIRYFGATMSVDYGDERLADAIPDHFTGPVQFSPGKSFHRVLENEEYDSLTSVIATGEGKEQGGFDLDDHRIQYALIGFHGIVNENAAQSTRLSPSDVKRLDTLCWRSIKNQTLSRSKMGQEPRLYLRVEYEEDSFHLGGLTHDLSLDDESTSVENMRNIRDVVVDISDLIDRLNGAAERIDTVHVCASEVIRVANGSESGGVELLFEELEDAVGPNAVRRVDVGTEFTETLPE